ncbi:MAG TPA: GtrA family protein [Nitrososphaerales archaeon]|nr:GtrA family protein [Nitrososphaerales archaeon]
MGQISNSEDGAKTSPSEEGRPKNEKLGLLGIIRSPVEGIRQNWTLAKFMMVGLSGVVVNLVLLTLFGFVLGNSQLLLANAIGVEGSILNNFVWNDRFTFRNRIHGSSGSGTSGKLGRLAKYNVLSLGSFAVNEFVFYLMTSFVLTSKASSWNYIPSSLVAVAVAFIVNYFGSSRWAWKPAQHESAKQAKTA